ncbi:hypothetical protein C5614_05165 [Massilia phosphatilytica]|nr:hypothetical protein C5614_05165 [Massilia phosphatilytica]
MTFPRNIFWFPAALACALALVNAPACAGPDDEAATGAATESPEQALYREALEALSEGRRSDASETLRRLVEQSPLHAGAFLELALTQCGLGNAEEAERLFAIIETRFNPSRDLLALIAETREGGCKKWTPSRSTLVTAGRGFDHNVNQGASVSSLIIDNGTPIELPLLPEFRPQSDQYSVIGVDHLRELTPNGSIGYLQYQLRRNDRLRQYDSAAVYMGMETPWRVGRSTVRTSGGLGAVSLGGHLYQRLGQLQARVSPGLPLPAGAQLNLVASATYSDYLTLANFNSLMLEGRAQLSWRQGPLAANASFSLMSDQARDQRPGGNRHGNFASLMLKRSLPADFAIELGYTRQRWDSALPYSPELLIDTVRAQRTETLRSSLSYQLGKQQTLQLEARAVRNSENIPIFQYNNRILQLSLQWLLP